MWHLLSKFKITFLVTTISKNTESQENITFCHKVILKWIQYFFMNNLNTLLNYLHYLFILFLYANIFLHLV